MQSFLVAPVIASECNAHAQIEIEFAAPVKAVSHSRRQIKATIAKEHSADSYISVNWKALVNCPVGSEMHIVRKLGGIVPVVVFAHMLPHKAGPNKIMRIQLTAMRCRQAIICIYTRRIAALLERHIHIGIDKTTVATLWLSPHCCCDNQKYQ